MNQMSKFELNPTANESGKLILLKLFQKKTQSPSDQSLAHRPLDASRIRKIMSNITVS